MPYKSTNALSRGRDGLVKAFDPALLTTGSAFRGKLEIDVDGA